MVTCICHSFASSPQAGHDGSVAAACHHMSLGSRSCSESMQARFANAMLLLQMLGSRSCSESMQARFANAMLLLQMLGSRSCSESMQARFPNAMLLLQMQVLLVDV